MDWHLKLETQLQSLLDLRQANSNDEDLNAVNIVWTVANVFGKREDETALAAAKDQQGWVCLQALKYKISDRRTSTQQWQYIK